MTRSLSSALGRPSPHLGRRAPRHFAHLDAALRSRLFAREPGPIDADAPARRVGTGLGATLYCPGTRPRLARDLAVQGARGVCSVVICLEDAVPDALQAAAARNTVGALRELAAAPPPVLPLVFVRIRRPEQVAQLTASLGSALPVLTGFVLPKFDARAPQALAAVAAAGQATGHRLFAMPVLETPDVAHAATRPAALRDARALLDAHRALVPAVRVGAADLAATFGLRRDRDTTVWDVRLLADAIGGVLDVFAGAAPVGPGGGYGDHVHDDDDDHDGYAVSGPVWEHYGPAGGDAWNTLLREIRLDRANGLLGKTVVHPSHVPAVHALSVVTYEDWTDACDVLAADRGGVTASRHGNKMNEAGPHAAWARRTVARAEAFGVAREGVSCAALLTAAVRA